jgi:O-antigen/teichoic acid export membrane protein
LGLGTAPILFLLLSSVIFYTNQYKYFAPNLKFVHFKFAKDIMGLGIKFFVIQISAIFVFQSTNIIISQLLGSEQVTIYNIAYKYFFLVLTLTNIIVAPFWSAFTEAYSKDDFDWMKNVVRTLNRIWYFVLILIGFMFLISNIVYKFWIGDAVIIPISTSFFLALNAFATARFAIFVLLINGIGKIKLQLYANVILSILYIPLTIYLGKQFGLNGIIISNIIMSTVFAVLAPIQMNRILAKKAKGIWNK